MSIGLLLYIIFDLQYTLLIMVMWPLKTHDTNLNDIVDMEWLAEVEMLSRCFFWVRYVFLDMISLLLHIALWCGSSMIFVFGQWLKNCVPFLALDRFTHRFNYKWVSRHASLLLFLLHHLTMNWECTCSYNSLMTRWHQSENFLL